MKKKFVTNFSKPHIFFKFILYLKNIIIISNLKKIKIQTDHTLIAKKLHSRCKLTIQRWIFIYPLLQKKYHQLLSIFKTNNFLTNISFGPYKAEIKIRTKKGKSGEYQADEFPAITLLMSKTFEFINIKTRGLYRFTQDLFLKTKIIKSWIRRYKQTVYSCKTILFGETPITNFLIVLHRIVLGFPRMFLRKIKIHERNSFMLSIINFWTWNILNNLQMNPNNLGLKNIYIDPINITINIITKHKQNTAWHIFFFLHSISFYLYLRRKKLIISRHSFFWHSIKAQVIMLSTKSSAIFITKKKNKNIRKWRLIFVNVLKKYIKFVLQHKKNDRHVNILKFFYNKWRFFKRIRLLLNLTNSIQ